MINVVLVDDHKIVREGIKSLLQSAENINVIAEGKNGLDAVCLTEKYEPDVLIVDIEMPKQNGLEVVKILKEKKNSTSILVLSMYDDEQYIIQALNRGADGYILKDTGKDELIRAIDNVCNGKKHFTAEISDVIINYFKQEKDATHDLDTDVKLEKEDVNDKTDFSVLTKREKQILTMLYDGKNNKEISTILSKSIRTIETHRFNIMKKMDVASIVELIKKVDNSNLNIKPI